MRRLGLGGIVGLVALYCAPALAQTNPADQAAAEVLFEEGRKLMVAGDYDHACPKFESSQKLDPEPGTQFNLAACYDKAGRTASAWITYEQAASASTTAGRAEWAEKAKEKAASLEGRLARLTITVAADFPGFEVHRDGMPVAGGAYGVALPIDPGEHVVEAIAPHKNKWRKKVTVAAAQQVQIKIPPLTDESDTSGVSESDQDTPVDTAPPPPKEAPTTGPSRGTGQRIAGWSIIGLSAVMVGFGSAFGLMAKSKQSDASDPKYCRTDTICTSAGAALIDDAKTDATVSTILFVTAGVALAGGITILLTAPSSAAPPASPPPTAQLRLGAPGSLAGLSLGGAW